MCYFAYFLFLVSKSTIGLFYFSFFASFSVSNLSALIFCFNCFVFKSMSFSNLSALIFCFNCFVFKSMSTPADSMRKFIYQHRLNFRMREGKSEVIDKSESRVGAKWR
jgi:hypothetical protein